MSRSDAFMTQERVSRERYELREENANLKAAIRQALEHVSELREAWMTGALSENDGKGGLRSNRNAYVESLLAAALGEPNTTGDDKT